MAASTGIDVKCLIAKKDEIEKEIKELSNLLESQKDIGMEGSLVDGDNFPRSDIDIYSVRHARQRIIRLQTDHKELMKEIEEGLYALHAKLRQQKEDAQQTEQPAQPMEVTEGGRQLEGTAFVKVDRVDAGSPADNAGLQVGDLITKFGSISLDNFKNLQDIGKVVQHSVGRPVSVTVLRAEKELHLGLVPQTWSGRGMLGCNILPLKT